MLRISWMITGQKKKSKWYVVFSDNSDRIASNINACRPGQLVRSPNHKGSGKPILRGCHLAFCAIPLQASSGQKGYVLWELCGAGNCNQVIRIRIMTGFYPGVRSGSGVNTHFVKTSFQPTVE